MLCKRAKRILCMNFSFDIDNYLDELYKRYTVEREGVSVNFRSVFPLLNGNDRYSHSIHPYPAKLIAHIPYFFLNSRKYIKQGEIVLDPFCGSGTTLLEASLSGINAYGADANPLARLISKCKTNVLKRDVAISYLSKILNEVGNISSQETFWFKNIDLWFSDRVQTDLLKLYYTINSIRKGKYRDFFLMCFSATLGKTSYTDPRIAVPVRINVNRYAEGSKARNNAQGLIDRIDSINVFETFEVICKNNLRKICTLNEVANRGKSQVISADARRLTTSINSNKYLEDESVDMILTSPPYASAQKYIRSSSLSLYWLRMLNGNTLADLDNKNIGRENYCKSEIQIRPTGINVADEIIEKIYQKYPLRGSIVCNYLLEMEKALDESVRVLKHGKYMILIIGNNNVCGFKFNTKHYLTEYLQTRGMYLELQLIDDIKSYGLMTKRNKTANIITREWILVFKKEQ